MNICIESDFVVSTPANQTPNQETRTRIRRHAMKKAAIERRRMGNYGKCNLRQLPVFEDSPQPTPSESLQDEAPETTWLMTPDSQSTRAPTKCRQLQPKDTTCADSPAQLEADYPQLNVFNHFARHSPCPLANLQLGLDKNCGFLSDHTQLEGTFVFPYGRNSILSFVPSRYGQVPCLTYAADCVVERLQWIIEHRRMPDDGWVVSGKYIKVLKCLQIALADADECLTPETLCTIELLAIFELLGFDSGQARIRHASGANRVIEHRGPARFQSEFEKSLFIAHVGSIVAGSLRDGTSCFLADHGWEKVFHSAVLPGDRWGERSEMIMSLWLHLVRVPSLFKTTEQHICLQDQDDDAVAALIILILKQITDLYIWYKQYSHQLQTPNEIPPCEAVRSATKDDMLCVLKRVRRAQLHKSYLSMLIILFRLLLALAPARFHTSESRCQSLARKVTILQEQLENSNQPIMGGMFGTLTYWIAKSTIQTEDQWKGKGIYQKGEFLDRDTFVDWCRAFGRV
ncbi:hypothetical protein H2200_013229 [Cladophialophora chaetospira]|uniref:Uncharacterized protein n=1 Tax=Cladophialophora chaetospira TaxID=386627 RepID=A0AA39CBJ9_9EURO|nr:hypothetical protein H2200_013229 [Cladophialophora chaetospira]